MSCLISNVLRNRHSRIKIRSFEIFAEYLFRLPSTVFCTQASIACICHPSITLLIIYRIFFLYAVFKVRYVRLTKVKRNGDGEIRTLDPLLARQVLSQLSYTPILIWQPPAFPHRLQCSIIGRSGLNHRVRDGNGCVP